MLISQDFKKVEPLPEFYKSFTSRCLNHSNSNATERNQQIVKEHGGLHISERRQFLCLARRGIHMNIIIICFCNFSIAAAHKNHHSPNVVGLSMDNYLLPYPIKLGPITTLLIIIIIIMSPFFSNSGSNVETSRNDYLIRLYKICLHPKLDGIDDLIKTPLARHSHRRSAPCKE